MASHLLSSPTNIPEWRHHISVRHCHWQLCSCVMGLIGGDTLLSQWYDHSDMTQGIMDDIRLRSGLRRPWQRSRQRIVTGNLPASKSPAAVPRSRICILHTISTLSYDSDPPLSLSGYWFPCNMRANVDFDMVSSFSWPTQRIKGFESRLSNINTYTCISY